MPDEENSGVDAPDEPTTEESPGIIQQGLNALGMGSGDSGDAGADPVDPEPEANEEPADEGPDNPHPSVAMSRNMSAKNKRKYG